MPTGIFNVWVVALNWTRVAAFPVLPDILLINRTMFRLWVVKACLTVSVDVIAVQVLSFSVSWSAIVTTRLQIIIKKCLPCQALCNVTEFGKRVELFKHLHKVNYGLLKKVLLLSTNSVISRKLITIL